MGGGLRVLAPIGIYWNGNFGWILQIGCPDCLSKESTFPKHARISRSTGGQKKKGLALGDNGSFLRKANDVSEDASHPIHSQT